VVFYKGGENLGKRQVLQIRISESDNALLEFCTSARNKKNKSELIRFLIFKEFERIVQERETEVLQDYIRNEMQQPQLVMGCLLSAKEEENE
jgi:hypothetical protein